MLLYRRSENGHLDKWESRKDLTYLEAILHVEKNIRDETYLPFPFETKQNQGAILAVVK